MLKQLKVWEILVPRFRLVPIYQEIPEEFHREWDKQVMKITGGLTLNSTMTGKWTSDHGITYKEEMIAVRIACSEKEIQEILTLTKSHYQQEAVFVMLVSQLAYILE